jgi:ABC-type lipoprotein release transport system permease subunit
VLTGEEEEAMLDRVRERWVTLSAVFIIGWRQIRDSWGLLLVAGLGIMLAVMLTVMMPFYAYLTLDARLQNIIDGNTHAMLGAKNPNITITLDLDPRQFGNTGFGGMPYEQRDEQLRALVKQQLGTYLQPQSWHAIQTAAFNLQTHDAFGAPQTLIMIATSPADLGSQPAFVQGRMPQEMPIASDPTQVPLIEGALPVDAAQDLHVTVGSVLTVPAPDRTPLIQIRITGIFHAPISTSNAFFRVENFQTFRSGGSSGPEPITYSLLVPQQSFLAAANQVGFDQLPSPISLYWFYQPNFRTFTLDDLGDVTNRLAHMQDNLNQALANSSEVQYYVASSLIGSDSEIQVYHAQVTIAALPITILLLDIIGIVIFFVSFIAELLVDSQTSIIAQFRARGISRAQVFGAYLLQSLSLAAGALILGLLGTFAAERLVLSRLVSQGAYHPVITLQQGIMRWLIFALIVAGSAMLAMWLSTAVALQSDVLAVRREASRSTRKPVWQRFHLDLALVLVLLVSFGLSSYALATVTDPQTAELLAPLSLLAPTFLVVAGILVLLRALPWLFQRVAQAMTRNRATIPFLALLQLARTPQYLLRMVFLYALIVAFTVYVFIFSASQNSRVVDLAEQQVGADITGRIPDNLTTNLSTEQKTYQSMPGVASASLGFNDQGSPIISGGASLVNVLAIDTDTYAHTAIWPGQSAGASVSLLSTLTRERRQAITRDEVPALVNASAWNALHLSQGSIFHLIVSTYDHTSMKLIAVAEVPSIPTLDPTQPAILVDYLTYGGVRQRDTNNPLPLPTQVWLRMRNQTTALDQVRAAITKGSTKLENIADRQMLESSLRQDPLASLIMTLLTVGLVLPLALIFIGNLIAIWIQMREQVVQFALLRALGMVPTQIRNLLTWELGVMQGVALALGCMFGGILAVTLTPTLVFTTTSPDALQTPLAFYQLQTVLPVRIVIPPAVPLVLAALSTITLGTVTLSVLWLRRLAISQALRLNED